MAKKGKKWHFGRDISTAVRDLAGPAGAGWPCFSLVRVDFGEIGVDEAALSGTAHQVLAAAELATFQGLRFPRRRREWLAGRLAVKEAIRTLLPGPLPPLAAVEIAVDQRGKPFYTPDADDVARGRHIAISHSGDTALGLASVVPCALDLQVIRASLARVVPRFAGMAEMALLQPRQPERLIALGLLWAAKEALRKHVSLWPLLGFLEAGLVEVVGEGDGLGLSFQPRPEKRELPGCLPLVWASLYEQAALAIILDGRQAGRDFF